MLHSSAAGVRQIGTTKKAAPVGMALGRDRSDSSLTMLAFVTPAASSSTSRQHHSSAARQSNNPAVPRTVELRRGVAGRLVSPESVSIASAVTGCARPVPVTSTCTVAGAGAIGLDLQLERDRFARPDLGHRLEADLTREMVASDGAGRDVRSAAAPRKS